MQRPSTVVRPMIRPWIERVLIAAALAATVYFYYMIAKANSAFVDWGDMDYFHSLARGWRQGHLYLDHAPSPELLALQDPYDPLQNEPHRLGDASFYRGHYYIYFGATPTFTLILPYLLLTGKNLTMGVATFIFTVVAFLTASGLWLALRRRYFPASRSWIAPLGILGLGFGTHLLALVQRPLIWELPIAAGVAFTMFALLAIYGAIHGRRPLMMMAAAGLCVGLATGSRPTVLLAAPLLLAPVWLAWHERKPGREWWRLGLAALVPLAACGLAIVTHNYARFENPFEFGQGYQLSGAYEGKWTHFSLRFLPHNAAVYFFQTLAWEWRFPFVLARVVPVENIPGYFGTEEVSGIAVTLPFVWLALGMPLMWSGRESPERRQFAAIFGGIAAATLLIMGVILCYFSTCARYQADFGLGCGVLAALGLLGFERWALRPPTVQGESASSVKRFRPKLWVLGGVVSVLGFTTVLVGALMGFEYHGRSTRRSGPALWQSMDRKTHALLANAALKTGWITGPRVLKVRFKPQPAGTIETFWRATDPQADEAIVVEHIGDHLIRFGYRRNQKIAIWGRPLDWETDHTHTVEVQLPSLYDHASTQGTMGGLRRNLEFRERTGAAVWFSGGQALSTITDPWPRTVQSGGEISAEFSGTVRKMSRRLFRNDEVEGMGLSDPLAPRGGILSMHIVLPPDIDEEGEPLFAIGAHYESSIVVVRAVPGGVKFTYENFAISAAESIVVVPNPQGHRLEMELPSCRADAFGTRRTGEVVIRLDGREILRSTQIGYSFGHGYEEIGRNPFGTNCASEFRGWLLDVKWLPAFSRP